MPLERPRWPGLDLVRIGCPGATTDTMIDGGGHCAYADGIAAETAVAFLHAHPSTVLVTVDLGFNDVLPCLRHVVVDATAWTARSRRVHDQLGRSSRRCAGGRAGGRPIVGVGHYDPYLGDYIRGPAGQAFADASLGVIERLDEILRAAYRAAGMPMADVAAAFDLRTPAVTDGRDWAWCRPTWRRPAR